MSSFPSLGFILVFLFFVWLEKLGGVSRCSDVATERFDRRDTGEGAVVWDYARTFRHTRRDDRADRIADSDCARTRTKLPRLPKLNCKRRRKLNHRPKHSPSCSSNKAVQTSLGLSCHVPDS